MPKKKDATSVATTQNKEVSKKEETLNETLVKYAPQIVRITGSEKEADKLIRVALTAVRKNPDLEKCTNISIFAAVLSASQLGLDLDDIKGHIYLIPRRDKSGNLQANLQMGYKGLVVLGNRHPDVAKITAQIVYENDEFYFEHGTEEKYIHRPYMGEPGGRGNITHYYAFVYLANGSILPGIMRAEDVIAHMTKYAQGFEKNSSAWKTDFDAMALKTVLIKALKLAPESSEDPALIRALGYESLEAGGLSQQHGKEHGFEDSSSMAEKTTNKTAELATKLAKSETKAPQEKKEKPKTTAKDKKGETTPAESDAVFEDVAKDTVKSVTKEIQDHIENADMSPGNVKKWETFLSKKPSLPDLIKNRDNLLHKEKSDGEDAVMDVLINLVHTARVDGLISESDEFDYNEDLEKHKADPGWLKKKFDSLEAEFTKLREDAGGGDQGDLNFSDKD